MSNAVVTEVVMPRLSDSMEEGTIVQWLVGHGEPVVVGDALVEIETDKATMEYEAEDGGLLEVIVPAGATVLLGDVIARLLPLGTEVAAADYGDAPSQPSNQSPAAATAGVAASGLVAPAAAMTPVSPSATPAPGMPPRAGRVRATPVARRLAASLGLDLAQVVARGRRGQIMKADIEAHARRAPRAAEASPRGTSAAAPAPDEFRPLSSVQQKIAQRMVESRATVPDFELSVDIDMAACVRLRAELAEQCSPVPSINDMVVRACALVLRDHPRVNGSYRDGGLEAHGAINVGVAVAADDALLVVVVPDSDKITLAALAGEMRRLAEAARAGTITPAQMSGATFTVSNLGMFGIDRFTPIVNAPQAAILAVGVVAERPVVRDGAVVARPVMTATLASDHRIVYGADAARFISDLRSRLEAPLSLLI